jgi:DNA-binding response OmpR family regulator
MPRILLIEDDDAVRDTLHEILKQLGYDVKEARDGKQGLALFKAAGADVVITDIVMPEMEGMQVIRELRQIDPAVKIIAMSGGGRQSAQDYLKVARILGAVRILPKPFPSQILDATIREILAESPNPPQST